MSFMCERRVGCDTSGFVMASFLIGWMDGHSTLLGLRLARFRLSAFARLETAGRSLAACVASASGRGDSAVGGEASLGGFAGI